MGFSGLIDWHRLMRTEPWRAHSGSHTFVYAFWMVDDGTPTAEAGISIIKRRGTHPDWFIHADAADTVLSTAILPDLHVGPGHHQVVDSSFRSRPMLAAMLLGTADFVLRDTSGQQYWHAAESDIHRPGWRIVEKLNNLYLRPCQLLTFLHDTTDETGNSGAGSDPRPPSGPAPENKTTS